MLLLPGKHPSWDCHGKLIPSSLGSELISCFSWLQFSATFNFTPRTCAGLMFQGGSAMDWSRVPATSSPFLHIFEPFLQPEDPCMDSQAVIGTRICQWCCPELPLLLPCPTGAAAPLGFDMRATVQLLPAVLVGQIKLG